MLSNMPVQSTVPGLNVTRPEIYFGESTDTDVYVKTRQQEFNYPQGDTNNLTSYQGTGGIVLGGLLRRILLAFDLWRSGQAAFQRRRELREPPADAARTCANALSTLAPFLTFEQDPYIVLGDDGRLSWIIDAFTTSDNYPYSTHYGLRQWSSQLHAQQREGCD